MGFHRYNEKSTGSESVQRFSSPDQDASHDQLLTNATTAASVSHSVTENRTVNASPLLALVLDSRFLLLSVLHCFSLPSFLGL